MINRISLYRFIGVAIISSVLVFQVGCTKNDEQQDDEQQAEVIEEKGKIEQMTDKAAETAVKKIRTPINKARATQNLGDDRLEAMDKVLQQQQ